jgi:hypothetical protein
MRLNVHQTLWVIYRYIVVRKRAALSTSERYVFALKTAAIRWPTLTDFNVLFKVKCKARFCYDDNLAACNNMTNE